MGEKGRDALRERAAEHQDGQVDTSAADGERVLEAPGREGEGAAVVGEGARDPSRAVPVGVRLEGGDDLRVRAGEAPEHAQVVAKGREVEFGPVRSDGFQVSPPFFDVWAPGRPGRPRQCGRDPEQDTPDPAPSLPDRAVAGPRPGRSREHRRNAQDSFTLRNRFARVNPVRSNRSGEGAWERRFPRMRVSWERRVLGTLVSRPHRSAAVLPPLLRARHERSQEEPFPRRAVGIDARP